MIKNFLVIILISILATLQLSAEASNSRATVEVEQEDINIQNEISKASIVKKETMRQFFSRVSSELGFGSYGAKKQGTMFFFKGEAIVSLKPSDPDFGRAVVIAYEKALLDLQANYIVDTFGRVSSKRLSSLYNDSSTNAKDFEDKIANTNKVDRIVDKALDYMGAKLDKGLKDLGVDPKNLNEKRKKVLFKNEFIKSVLTSAYGNISGLVPIRTHVTFDKKGNYSVGLVAVLSAKTKQIARDMSLKRKSLIKGKGKDITSFIPKDSKDFLNELGIRLVYDKEGKPTIISYGRWSYSENSSDAYINKMASQTALAQAKTLGDAAIIEFMKTRLSFKSESKTGEIIRRVLTKEIDSETQTENLSDEVIKDIVSKIGKEVKAISSGRLKGITTLTDWEEEDKHGIIHVGVVRIWNYDNVIATNNMLKSKYKKKKKNSSKKTVFESKPVNTLNDF